VTKYRTAAEKAELKRKGAANRLAAIGAGVYQGVRRVYDDSGAETTIGATTSGAPLIRMVFPDGTAYHVTVTKART
jgi:hypothetical protein